MTLDQLDHRGRPDPNFMNFSELAENLEAYRDKCRTPEAALVDFEYFQNLKQAKSTMEQQLLTTDFRR